MRILFPTLFLALTALAQTPVQLSPATPPPTTAPAPPAPVAPDAVVAEVDGKKYTAAEADRLMSLFPPQQQIAVRKDPKRALGYILLLRHLAAEAEKANLDKQSPLKEELEFGRIGALSQAQVNQVRNYDVNVDLKDQEKFYKEHPDQFQEAKVKVIYVAFTPAALMTKREPNARKPLSEAEAKAKVEDLRKQIEGGADFGKLAKQNSDDQESAAKDGDFGTIKRSSPYPETVKTTVFSLKAGEVSQPVREKNGFYLIRLESVSLQPYEEVRTQIYEDLKQKSFNTWWQDLQKRYDVTVENPAYFTPKTGPIPAAPAH